MYCVGLSSDGELQKKRQNQKTKHNSITQSLPETEVSKITGSGCWDTYFSSGKLKFLLNFNTHSKKCFTQQQALHKIICSAHYNEHLPRLILISFCTAEACCPRDPHLELTFLSGAISFPYLGEKWHLFKILKHATLG